MNIDSRPENQRKLALIAFRIAVLAILGYIAYVVHDISNTPALDWSEGAALEQIASDVEAIKRRLDTGP